MASDAPTDNTLQPMDAPTASAPGALHNLPNDILHPAEGAADSPASDAPLTAEQRSLSLKVSLADLAARASHHYAQKHYEDAAEGYAAAAEMQAEMNGELSAENGEILFLYGRSLFRVGQSKSDVLGGAAPQTEKKKKKKEQRGRKRKVRAYATIDEEASNPAPAAEDAKTEDDKVVEEVMHEVVDRAIDETKKDMGRKNQMFQFTGDENWDDSEDDEEEDAGEGGEDEEEEDDLATAFEILDLARVLLKKKLEEKLAAVDATEGKGKEVANGQGEDAEVRHIKERLADTHELLTDISLENEQYPKAIADCREALSYWRQLYSEDHEYISSAHFKLSLALEFASVTSQGDDEGTSGPKEINQELRDEAAKELEAAIASSKMKLHNKEVELATLHNPEDNDISRSQITDMKEMIADMEQRLVDLRGPPVDLSTALGGESLGGILGGLMGAPAAQTEARLEEAKKTATDLTGLVRKKSKPASATAAPAAAEASNGKRKAEEDVAMDDSEAIKKPRTAESEST